MIVVPAGRNEVSMSVTTFGCGVNPVEACQLKPLSVVSAISDPAMLIDRNYRILAVNESFQRIYSAHPPVCGRKCHEVSHGHLVPCGDAGEDCPLRLAINQGCASTTVHTHHTPEGPMTVEVSITPLQDTQDRYVWFVETVKPLVSSDDPTRMGRVIGKSATFLRALELARSVAGNDVPVLLLGETGTGKEVLAETIHQLSVRRNGPYVPMDSSAISPSLFESELLGHERGAFTGATDRRRGLAEAADGGTLFLDEVGDIPLELQVKLLRLLETKVFRRVGSEKPLKADFRLICATHRNLTRMVSEGTFRQDLYYRINMFPIQLPPLRARLDDIPLLIDHFRGRFGCGFGCQLDRCAAQLLHSYAFPGNVRELANIVRRACLLAEGGIISPEHLPPEVTHPDPDKQVPNLWEDIVPLEHIEQRYLLWAAGRFGGDRNELAEKLGVSERTLYRKLGAAQRLMHPDRGA